MVMAWPRRFELPLKLALLFLLGLVIFLEFLLYRQCADYSSAFFMSTEEMPVSSTIVTRPAVLPEGLYPGLVAARQQEGGAAYEVQRPGPVLTAHNPTQQLEISFDKAGVQVNGWQMHLHAVGYGAQAGPELVGVTPTAQANRVEFRYGLALTEWYVNGPLGLEQGFDLAQPPVSPIANQPLRLEISLNGATACLDSDGAVLLQAANSSLRYGQLWASDATGKRLPARLEVAPDGQSLAILVEDRAAVYPLTIDPLIQQAKLVASDPTPYAAFGSAVALSADGNTALVGASGPSSSANVSGAASRGAAYVFTRAGNAWGTPTKLQPTDSSDYDSFGAAVALSADGNTALIGSDNKAGSGGVGQGKAYVFTRPDNTAVFSNTSQIDLIAADGNKYDNFGISVALDAGGTTALVGAYNQNNGGVQVNGKGAAYVFTRTVGSPFSSTNQTKLSALDNSGFFGVSVALSSDGNLALIGSPGNFAAYAYSRASSSVPFSNSLQSKLTVGGFNSYSLFGSAVALSSDGNTALIGAPGDNSFQGAAYVLTRTTGSAFITTTATKLSAADPSSTAELGTAVALSGDGNTALVGTNVKSGPGGANQGAAYTFTRPNNSASFSTTVQTKLLAPDGATSDHFANALALSNDGNTALIGAFTRSAENGTAAGAAYVFAPAVSLTLSLQSAPNPADWGAAVVFTATVRGQYPGGPAFNGQLAFLDGSSVLVTRSLSASGVATFTTSSLSPGSHSITAVYSDTVNGQLSSNVVTQVIQPAPTATSLTVVPIPATPDQIITLTATVSVTNGLTYAVAPTGTVSFYANNNALTSLPLDGGSTSAVYTTTLPGGSYNLYVVYSGNLNFAASTSPTVTEQVVCNSLMVTTATDKADPNDCGSFSSALALANQASQPVTITFSPAITTINLTQPLATRVANRNGLRLIIEGGCNSGKPGVQLRATVSSGGLVLDGNVGVDGLSLTGFNGYAVELDGDNSALTCSYIGLNPDGTNIEPNSLGIIVQGSNDTLGRADDPASGNVIVGNNGPGLMISFFSHDARLYYNLVGVLPSGATATTSPLNSRGALRVSTGNGVHIGQGNRFMN